MRANHSYEANLHNEAWMRRNYEEMGKTAAGIGIEVGCPTSTVVRALRLHGIKVRHESKSPEMRPCPNSEDPLCKKEFLVGGRGNRARSAVFCSRHCHMMHQSPRATASSEPRPKKNHTTIHNKEWLTEHYVTKKMSMGEIGILCNCSAQSVHHALQKFEIPVRSGSIAMLGRTLRRGDPVNDDGDGSVARNRRRSTEARRQLKREMVNAYGGKCACCGETEIAFLCLDHPNGGGIRDRTSAGGSEALLRRLKKEGWPKGNYRVLCANCNIATKYGRTCPHQLKKETT